MIGISLPSISFEEFPYPPHSKDEGVDLFMQVLPLITLFGFILLVPAVMTRIVEEKATGIKVRRGNIVIYLLIILLAFFSN